MFLGTLPSWRLSSEVRLDFVTYGFFIVLSWPFFWEKDRPAMILKIRGGTPFLGLNLPTLFSKTYQLFRIATCKKSTTCQIFPWKSDDILKPANFLKSSKTCQQKSKTCQLFPLKSGGGASPPWLPIIAALFRRDKVHNFPCVFGITGVIFTDCFT